MEITINTAAVLSVFGVFSALAGMMAWIFNARARFIALEKHDKRDHEMITQLVKGQVATLEGLKQLGCNGAVTKAYEDLKKYTIEHY